MEIKETITYAIDRLEDILVYLRLEYTPSEASLSNSMSDLASVVDILRKIQHAKTYGIDKKIIVQINGITEEISIIRTRIRFLGKNLRSAYRAGVLKQASLGEELDSDISNVKAKLENLLSKLDWDMNSPMNADFIIITALEDEVKAILEKLPGYKKIMPSKDDVRTYYYAELPVTYSNEKQGKYRIIVTSLLGMGRVQASITATDAIRRWNPPFVLLVGIAGGVAANGVKLGDILIADQIVDYELQKQTPHGDEIRWTVYPCDPRLLGAAQAILEKDWRKLLRTKRPAKGKSVCHVGPVASGDKVISVSEQIDKHRGVWVKLVGAEMEAGGVAPAVYQSVQRPGFFMVRAVSDLADQNKDDSWRAYACDAAAAYTIGLIRNGPVPLQPIGKNRSR